MQEKDRAWLVELLEKGEDDEVDENLGKNIFDPMVLITKGSEGKRVNPYHKNDLANKPKPMKQLRKRPRNGGVMETVSEEIVGRRRLLFLCFDEFQLNDIGNHTHIRHRRKSRDWEHLSDEEVLPSLKKDR
jgi:hypothetical protein